MNQKNLFFPLIFFLALFLLGCQADLATPTNIKPTSLPAATVTTLPLTPTLLPLPSSDASEIPLEPAERLYALLDRDEAKVDAVIQQIISEKEESYIPVFIELLRAAQIGLVQNTARYGNALNQLAEPDYFDNWAEWIEWYGATDIAPPPGFTGWKGELLAGIDHDFANFLQDDFASSIRVEEIVWGGVPVDGIPALDNPKMISASDDKTLTAHESVFGMVINGDARAYPLRYMDWHEMANDVIGGVPVSIAYCTLCGAAVAYDGRASDGLVYDFGSSGFLFRSNKLMYDRQTRTLWNQLTGEPVLGELVGSGITLDILPIVLTTWEDWQTQQPETLVIAPETGFARIYVPGAAYGNYFSSPNTMFPVWQRSDLLDTKEQIFALRIDGAPKAYPIATLTEEDVVNDRIGETNVVLIAGSEPIEMTGDNLRIGPVVYQTGAEIRAYERKEWEFAATESLTLLLDQNGDEWQITPDAIVGGDGARLERLGGHLAYWFGWFAFFPQTQLYGVDQ